jgi:hypothetical protein
MRDDGASMPPLRSLFPAPRALALVLGAAVLVVGVAALISVVSDKSAAYLTREPADAVRIEGCAGPNCAYAGFLSNLGILTWAVGAVAAGLAASLARRGAPERGMLAAAAGLTTLLLVDDMFMLHDQVFDAIPRGQKGFLAFEALLVGVFVVAYRRLLLAGPAGALVLAAGLIGLSTAIDVVAPGNHLIEDGIKFIGIASWATWLVLTALPTLRAGAARASPAA